MLYFEFENELKFYNLGDRGREKNFEIELKTISKKNKKYRTLVKSA